MCYYIWGSCGTKSFFPGATAMGRAVTCFNISPSDKTHMSSVKWEGNWVALLFRTHVEFPPTLHYYSFLFQSSWIGFLTHFNLFSRRICYCTIYIANTNWECLHRSVFHQNDGVERTWHLPWKQVSVLARELWVIHQVSSLGLAASYVKWEGCFRCFKNSLVV